MESVGGGGGGDRPGVSPWLVIVGCYKYVQSTVCTFSTVTVAQESILEQRRIMAESICQLAFSHPHTVRRGRDFVYVRNERHVHCGSGSFRYACNELYVEKRLPLGNAVSADDSKERVQFFTHAVDKRTLKPGDHIYAYRGLGFYSHHGIYTGEKGQEVIHFTGDRRKSKTTAAIQACSLDVFLSQRQLRLASYNETRKSMMLKRSGTVHKLQSLSADKVLNTAKHYLENPREWDNYHVLTNNCEHFAVYCKTEIRRSNQIFGFTDENG